MIANKSLDGSPIGYLRVLAVLIPAVLLLPTLLYPFSLDQSTYQTMALQLVKFGKLPYLGSWDENFPGIVFIHAVSITSLGNSELGFRLLDWMLWIAMGGMLFSLLAPRIGRRSGILAVAALALISLSDTGWSHGQRDGFATVFVVFGTWLLLKKSSILRPRAAILCLAGVTMGYAIAIRPTFGLIPICVLIGFRFVEGSWLRNSAWFCAGVLLPILAIMLPYAFHDGGLRELYLATFRFNADVYASSRYRVPLVQGVLRKSQMFCGFVVALTLLMLYFKKRKILFGSHQQVGFGRFETWLFWSYMAAAECSIMVMGKHFRYHYEMLFMLTAVLIGFLSGEILSLIKRVSVRNWLTAGLIVAATLLVMPWRIAGLFKEGLTSPEGAIEHVRNNYFPGHPRDRIERIALANYITAHTSPGNRIEYANEEPEILWRTALQPATRFTMIFPIAMQRPEGGYTDYQIRWQKEYVDSIASVKPKFMILTSDPRTLMNFLSQPDSVVLSIPGFAELLNHAYTVDTSIGANTLYLRKE